MHVPDRLTAWLHPPPPSAYYNTLTAFPRMLPIKFNWIKIFKFNHFQFLLIRPGLFSNPTKSIHQFSQNQSTRSSPCLFRAIMLIFFFNVAIPTGWIFSTYYGLYFSIQQYNDDMDELQHLIRITTYSPPFMPWIPQIHTYKPFHDLNTLNVHAQVRMRGDSMTIAS